MKLNFTFLFFGIFVISIFSQVGVGTDVIESSAALEVSAHRNPYDLENRGILIPRVALEGSANNVSPVANPVDGTLVFNNTVNSTENLNKTIYFWNDDLNKWNEGLYYVDTPKTSIIQFSGSPTDYFVLDNYNAGSTVTLGSPNLLANNYLYDSFAKFLGLTTYTYNNPNNGQIQNSISILPGKYLIEVSFACKAIPCNPTTRCSFIAGDYYYMGMFIDFYTPQFATDGTVTYGGRRRKEDGVLSKINQTYRITEFYSIEIDDYNYILEPRLGRMSGSSFNDGVYVIPSESYIKISKY